MSQETKPYIIFLSGASGAGKTSLVEKLNQKLQSSSVVCLHFDSIGVPSEKIMIEKYGSGTRWQELMTYQWVEKMTKEYTDKRLIIFEGQTNLSFIISAFKRVNFDHYKIVLVHCENSIRHYRLHKDRQQPELINAEMDNWSKYLKKQAEDLHIEILDTTHKNSDELISIFLTWLPTEVSNNHRLKY